ncbi:hypothetical protein B0T24DRAFT_626909 [Lasiosphaeria ovina]|uniref:Uncharacterized protein n=1 Tax=Lasiosphaeria ovina TaxID=92902 RepID=A0AAE0K6H7_9PEZI|nr:hypothetical protein B0T24DRAFT_626909 [Lasiosphaeria ovina]
MHFSAITAALLFGAVANAYEIVVYSDVGWTGAEASFTYDGRHYLDFVGHSWEFLSPGGDGCCVRFCYGGEPVGYRCSQSSNYRSSSPIDEVVTGCGDTQLDC